MYSSEYPTLVPSIDYPSSTPSTIPTTKPSFLSSGNVHVNYYDIALDTLPEGGLKSLTPYADGYVQNIDFQLGSSGFATSGKSVEVAALFSGFLAFPIKDKYYICITSDDGSKLFIEDTLVISNDGLHGAEQECALYDSSAGVKHIEVEYFQRGGGAILSLEFVPLSRPAWFRLMRVIEPSEFVPKPDTIMTENPSAFPTLIPTVYPSVSPSFTPTISPSNDPSGSPSESPSDIPSPTPSNDPSTSLTVLPSSIPSDESFGKVGVSYFATSGWTSLPSSGFSDLSPYKVETVETINYPYTEGDFAGSLRKDNVAALFQGTIQVSVPTSSWTLEAENAELSSSTQIENVHTGFTGTSYVDYTASGSAAYLKWEFPMLTSQAGYYDIRFRYALGGSDNRPLNVRVNGIDETMDFPGTGSWANWDYTESMRVYLKPGSNIINASAIGRSGANIDHLYIEAVPSTVGFCITSDDGSKLIANGETVILNDEIHSAIRECGSLEVTDSEVDVLVEYFERGGGSVLILEYSPPGTTEYSIVPVDAWI